MGFMSEQMDEDSEGRTEAGLKEGRGGRRDNMG